MGEYPQELLEEHQQLSTLVVELINRFQDGIKIHVIDPQSVTGIIRSIRYRVRKYPTFIINEKELVIGWDRKTLESALESRSSG